MLKKGVITLIVLSMFLAGSAFAKNNGNRGDCKDQKVVGSYSRALPFSGTDTFGNPFDRIWIRQLNLSAGGTVHQMSTLKFDRLITEGAQTSRLGSWKCRKDGKLLIQVMNALYTPVPAGALGAGSPADIELFVHLRTTYLFSVEDNDTLKQIQAVARVYFYPDDPADPTAGFLLPDDFTEFFFTRLTPSDADLAP